MLRDQAQNYCSGSRPTAALLHSSQGKVNKVDVVETKERLERPSPSSDTLGSCKRSKRSDRGSSIPRVKMGSFAFDDHLEDIWRGLSEDRKTAFALLDSMCFIVHNMGRKYCLDLIKSKDIFLKKYVLVPIVCWNHWRLAVFCHFGESASSETRTRCILLLDSMGMGAMEIEPHLRKFVFDIFKAEGRPEIKDAIYQIPILVPKVPQQRNDVDCGRFVLYFMKKFMDAAPQNFSLSNGYPYFMRPDWFTHDSFEDFCDKLEKESPPHPPRITATRSSQRIRNKGTLQQRLRNKGTLQQRRQQPPPPRTGGNTIYSRKLSKPEIEVILID